MGQRGYAGDPAVMGLRHPLSAKAGVHLASALDRYSVIVRRTFHECSRTADRAHTARVRLYDPPHHDDHDGESAVVLDPQRTSGSGHDALRGIDVGMRIVTDRARPRTK
jgi:hypothetical protein